MSNRLLLGLGFALCAALLGYGYYLEYGRGLEPCPLCVLQRVAFLAVGVVCLAGALHDPRAWGGRMYGLLALVPALAGAGIAWRQLYLQQLPPDAVPACGPGLDYLIETFPLHEALAQVLRGSGDCAEISPWHFLGLGIPEWALVWFAVLALFSLWLLVRPARG